MSAESEPTAMELLEAWQRFLPDGYEPTVNEMALLAVIRRMGDEQLETYTEISRRLGI